MEIKINLIEAASELAHDATRDEMIRESIIDDESEMFKKEGDEEYEEGVQSYTEQAQDIFNGWYSYFYDKIEECKVNERCSIRPDLVEKGIGINYKGKTSGYLSGNFETEYKWEGDQFYIWVNGEWCEAESIDFEFK